MNTADNNDKANVVSQLGACQRVPRHVALDTALPNIPESVQVGWSQRLQI